MMFPEIEGGTQMQPKIIGGTWRKMFENPCCIHHTQRKRDLRRTLRQARRTPFAQQAHAPHFLDLTNLQVHIYDGIRWQMPSARLRIKTPENNSRPPGAIAK